MRDRPLDVQVGTGGAPATVSPASGRCTGGWVQDTDPDVEQGQDLLALLQRHLGQPLRGYIGQSSHVPHLQGLFLRLSRPVLEQVPLAPGQAEFGPDL